MARLNRMVHEAVGFEGEGVDGEPAGGAGGAGGGDGESSGDATGSEGEPPASGAAEGSRTPKTVPYERLEAVSRKNQELERQHRELKEQFDTLRIPADQLEAARQRKSEEQEFWKNPFEYFHTKTQQQQQELQQKQFQMQDGAAYESSLQELRGSPGFSNELEQSMVKAIRAHGLNADMGRAKVLKMAYQMATGKEWGQWNRDGYQTRLTKQRLMRPAGGGGGSTQGMLSPEQFDALPIEKYAQNPDLYNAQMQAWHQAQG